MRHHATAAFWETYQQLPQNIQRLADENFALLKKDERHPSLHFKRIGRFWSVRIGRSWRALAVSDGDDVIWFWIGSHADCDRMVG